MVDVEGESWAPQVEDDDGHFDVEELLSLQSLSYLYEEEDPSTVWYYTPEEENTMQPNEEEEESATSLIMKVPRGLFNKTAAEYEVNRSTIYRIWKDAKRQMTSSGIINAKHKKKGRSGRKFIDVNLDTLRAIPKKNRTTLRSFGEALQVSPSTIYRWVKRGILRPHTNSIKPKLTEAHKVKRLTWVLSLSIPKTVTELSKFQNLSNMIHIDEKWFYMSHVTHRYYLLADEEDPYRSCQSKKWVNKVMFMGGIGRPLFSTGGVMPWDGKIGIYAFTEDVAAQRTSVNRDRGTVQTKAIQSITKEVIRQKIITELIPAIKAKWPTFATKTIWIQQDNARPHIAIDDAQFLEAANSDGFDMHLICQPAQSPDLNLLDLGFFRAIQSLQYKTFPTNVDELVKSVKEAYDAYDPRMINYTWVQLQLVMLEILKCKGGNDYKYPHIGKAKLDRQGKLPYTIEIPDEVVTGAVEHLLEGEVVV
ncbi:uncharacterized protein LOC125497841 [Beta vulgaris subsp. vulgaris]|uniref:uncharacterized protein LOC125497841 n=1 Tax=Beta vulgaris subsp. vulgaris TaxID=3555 RepID=UPI002546DBBA|nr:uncharacterized protein LOC125497841 [Beta vulgaris subsp. vulgaris]